MAVPELAQLPRFRIYCSPDDHAVGRHVHGNKIWEPHVTSIFERYIRPGMCVVDIGANIGYFTMLGAVLVGETGRVIAIEPNPENARMIEASRAANGFKHVTVIQAAAAAAFGLLSLETSFSNGWSVILPDNPDAILTAPTVCAVRLDALQIPRVDFIKIDVEGNEPTALGGFKETITRDRPIIASELSPANLVAKSDCSAQDYLRYLTSMGYNLAVIHQDGREALSNIDAMMDHFHSVAQGTDHIDIIAKAK
jgi:FkbM family methyltransferase